MAPVAQPATQFDILNDSSFTSGYDSDQSTVDIGSNSFTSPLGDVSVSDAQNRKPGRRSSGRVVESLAAELEKLHIGESQPHDISLCTGKPVAKLKTVSRSNSRPARPSITHSIFEVLETVPENDDQEAFTCAALDVSDQSQRYIEIPADQYTQHPLALAASKLPSAQEQLNKHRRGDFEWVLTIRVPNQSSSPGTLSQVEPADVHEPVRLYFGCNILPTTKTQHELGIDSQRVSYTLLVTPLENNAELDTATELRDDEKKMALTANVAEHSVLLKPLEKQPEVIVEAISPASSSILVENDSFVDLLTSRPPSMPVPRIEDSVEALDQLEEQLEAFDVAANMREVVSHDVRKPTPRPHGQIQSLSTNTLENHPARPRATKASPRPASSTLRLRSTEPKSSTSIRRSASMIFMDPPKLLDSPKLKVEDKALLQAPPKKPIKKGLTSLLQPKQPTKSTKPVTIPTFELPGEAVARRLKEQREARLSMAATVDKAQTPAPSSVRRTKSAKPPTRPMFELPGEAISRRKREERDAKLRAQEEEERRRREFKAKPIRSAGAPSSVPRGTATSRARQIKGPAPEIPLQNTSSSVKRVSIVAPHEPLSVATNQAQSRGRHLTTDSAQVSRATSSSTGSISGKRSSVSLEDVQAQRLRGKEILQRDSMYTQDRQREKRDREALARLAREQAAERSRLQSREWAEKQKRKRMTVDSLAAVVASS